MSLPTVKAVQMLCCRQFVPVVRMGACSLHSSASRHHPRRGTMAYLNLEQQRRQTVQKQDGYQKRLQFDPELEEFRKMSAEDLLHGAHMEEAIKPEAEFPSDMMEERDKYEVVKKRSQSKFAFRPKVDPKETSILLFPGQGAQFLGMGRDLVDYPNVQNMYDIASDILGYDLLDVCENGPESKLSQTIHQQPAMLVTSLAAVEKLRVTHPSVSYC